MTIAKPNPTICSDPECQRPAEARTPGAQCKMHADRRRKGRPNPAPGRLQRRGPWMASDGSLVMYDERHPLASQRGLVRLRRAVAFRVWGPGQQPCERCQRLLTWGVDLLVGVRDGDPANASPANLLATCRPCACRVMGQRSGQVRSST